MHPPGIGEEVAQAYGKGGVAGREPAKRGLVHWFRVRALGDLRELLGIAKQEQPRTRDADRQGVGPPGIRPGMPAGGTRRLLR